MTSRTGIYLNFTKKLIDGKFFGLTHRGPVWYAFGTHANVITEPSFKGYILQFELDNEENMINQKEILTGLDNGVHQLCIWKNYLYILETYIQQITIVNLDDITEKNVIHPFEKSISVQYHIRGYHGSFENYKHMNAITVQDDRFYIMCPHLRSKLEDGKASQDRNPSHIFMFGPDWKIIDKFDTGRYFCHDLVVIGHEIYFADATNTILKLNIVTREIEEVWTIDPVSPDLRKICRGLSISTDGNVRVGTHDFKGNYFVVDPIYKKQITVDETPCCIKRLDAIDFNDETSIFKQSYTLTLPSYTFHHTTNTILNNLKKVHKHQNHEGSEFPSIKEFLNPDLSSGGDLQNNINSSLHVPCLEKKVPLPHYLVESGPFFFYPKGHAINWHTNTFHLEYDENIFKYRIYTVSTTGNSYFLYRHPKSHKIHVIKDIDETSLVFNLCPGGEKFWHAVITMTGSRLSYGVKFSKETLKTLKIENIWEDEPETFRLVFKDNNRDFLGPQRIPNFLNENEINMLRVRLQDFLLKDGKIASYKGQSAVVEKIRRCKTCFIPKIYDFFPLYQKIFENVLKMNNQYFNFKLSEIVENIQYTEYDESYNGHYDWHLDTGCGQNSTRKLTIVIQLSDTNEYEGGELQVQNGEKPCRICNKEKGSMIIFPSFLLHRVTPVTKGCRRSLVLWIQGPVFI
jgi:PKHD-type hydroxylase